MLSEALARGVDVILAQRRSIALARQRQIFAAHGIRLQVASDAHTLALVDDKLAFYAAMDAAGIAVAPWRGFADLRSFDQALKALESWAADGPRTHSAPVWSQWCIKPAVGIFGHGFRILGPPVDAMVRLLDPENRSLGTQEFRQMLAASAQSRRWVLAGYLEGPEASVDILADRGRVIRAVARVKLDRAVQDLHFKGPECDLARRVVDVLGLDGLINVQTKSHQGLPYVLEVNARMAGGIGYAAALGLNLPHALALLLMGADPSLSLPDLTGPVRIRTRTVATPIIVPDTDRTVAA